ncbi:MAG TPA: hypothetical protein VNM92_11485 [Thermoanaerobaculia bacterium]|nr:hypothetical protein [Thermoanaerobaculia bacterium]
MKFQEVIFRAMSKQITWMQAAEILGMSDRNMRRYRNRLDKGGYDGLLDRVESEGLAPMALCEQAIEFIRTNNEHATTKPPTDKVGTRPTHHSLATTLDLAERVESLCARIRKWNGT